MVNVTLSSVSQQTQRELFTALKKITDISDIKPLFEYVVIIKLNEKIQPEFILELDWEAFFKHKTLAFKNWRLQLISDQFLD